MFVFTVENISNIKGLTYTKDGISDKHLERIEYSKTSGLLKDFNYSEYMIKTPPKNNSIQTYEELKFLSYLHHLTNMQNHAELCTIIQTHSCRLCALSNNYV